MPEAEKEKNKTKKFPWVGCISPDGQTILILYANLTYAWVYRYSVSRDNALTLCEKEPILVTQRYSMQIYYLSEDQAVVSCIRGFCVINFQSGLICYKFNFSDYLWGSLTISKLAVAVPRIKNGIIVNMGSLKLAKECFAKNLKSRCCRDMNHIFVNFSYLFFHATKGYLIVDEMLVDWDICKKTLPLKIMRRDYTGDVCDEKILDDDF